MKSIVFTFLALISFSTFANELEEAILYSADDATMKEALLIAYEGAEDLKCGISSDEHYLNTSMIKDAFKNEKSIITVIKPNRETFINLVLENSPGIKFKVEFGISSSLKEVLFAKAKILKTENRKINEGTITSPILVNRQIERATFKFDCKPVF